MNNWFNERYIKEIPIEEQIRGQVRAECHYMDKADIYEWIAQDEIKIMNLQSKIDKANEVLNQYMPNYASCVKVLDEIEFILKEEQAKETKELFEGTMDQLNDLSIFKENK